MLSWLSTERIAILCLLTSSVRCQTVIDRHLPSGDVFGFLDPRMHDNNLCSQRNGFNFYSCDWQFCCQCQYTHTYFNSKCTSYKNIKEGCKKYISSELRMLNLTVSGNVQINRLQKIGNCLSTQQVYDHSNNQWRNVTSSIFTINGNTLYWTVDSEGLYQGSVVKIGCSDSFCFIFKAYGILTYNNPATSTLQPSQVTTLSILSSFPSQIPTPISSFTSVLPTVTVTPTTYPDFSIRTSNSHLVASTEMSVAVTSMVVPTPTVARPPATTASVTGLSPAPKPTGRPDNQSSGNLTAPVAGAVVSAVVSIALVAGVIIVCRRKRKPKSSRPAKTENDAISGKDNLVYGHSRADVITLSHPRQQRTNSHAPSSSCTPDYEYHYAKVDDLPKKRFSSPVYQGLDRPDEAQVYQSLDQRQDGSDFPFYNTLGDPDSPPQYCGLKGPIPNNEYKSLQNPANTTTGAINEPVYNTLEEPDNPNQYYALKGSTQNHVYKSLEPKTPHTEMVNEPKTPHAEMVNEPVYNTLEESDRDYDNVSDEEDQDPAPGDVNEPVGDAFHSESHPEYARLEGPHTVRDTPKQDQAPDYDVLERPYPIKEHVCQAGKKRRGK